MWSKVPQKQGPSVLHTIVLQMRCKLPPFFRTEYMVCIQMRKREKVINSETTPEEILQFVPYQVDFFQTLLKELLSIKKQNEIHTYTCVLILQTPFQYHGEISERFHTKCLRSLWTRSFLFYDFIIRFASSDEFLKTVGFLFQLSDTPFCSFVILLHLRSHCILSSQHPLLRVCKESKKSPYASKLS